MSDKPKPPPIILEPRFVVFDKARNLKKTEPGRPRGIKKANRDDEANLAKMRELAEATGETRPWTLARTVNAEIAATLVRKWKAINKK
jgi:hypothetical protein